MTGPDRDREPGNVPEHVPDAVLDELMVAFSAEGDPPPKGFDFDDPSIDRLLGIQPDDDIDDIDDIDDDDDIDPDIDLEVVEIDEPAPEPVARATIVIEHEEVPDTVFLDETGDDDGERSTVVIGDLDDGPGIQPAPGSGSASSGSMDPRIRARRIANRRAEGRRRLIWVTLASAVMLLIVGAIALIASPVFDVRDVQVQGAIYTDPDILEAVVDSLRGEPVLLVDTQAAEATLEAVPWVERARVTADFPHTVRIDIREREPVAAFQGGDEQYRVIDVDGRVLDVIAGRPIAYVLITGDNPDTAAGQFAGAPYAAAAQLVIALPPDIRAITRSVGLDSTTGSMTMVLESPDDDDTADVEVRLGDDTALDDKLARLLQQVRDGLDGVCSIDVSTPEVGVVPGC